MRLNQFYGLSVVFKKIFVKSKRIIDWLPPFLCQTKLKKEVVCIISRYFSKARSFSNRTNKIYRQLFPLDTIFGPWLKHFCHETGLIFQIQFNMKENFCTFAMNSIFTHHLVQIVISKLKKCAIVAWNSSERKI